MRFYSLDDCALPLDPKREASEAYYNRLIDDAQVLLTAEVAAERTFILANRRAFAQGISFEEAWSQVQSDFPELVECSTKNASVYLNRETAAAIGATVGDAEEITKRLRPIMNRMEAVYMQPVQPKTESFARNTSGFEAFMDEVTRAEPEIYQALESQLSDLPKSIMPTHQRDRQVVPIFRNLIKELKLKRGLSFDQAWEWARQNQPALFSCYNLCMATGGDYTFDSNP